MSNLSTSCTLAPDMANTESSRLLQKFPHQEPRPIVERADGMYIHTKDGRRLMDATAGTTSFAVLGYNHPEVLDAMRSQMERFCHVDMLEQDHRELASFRPDLLGDGMPPAPTAWGRMECIW